VLYQLSYASGRTYYSKKAPLFREPVQACLSKEGGCMKVVKLDCRGMSCPEPLMILKNAVRPLEKGDRVEILSDDPVSLRDFPAFCKFMGHLMAAMPDEAHPHLFIIEK